MACLQIVSVVLKVLSSVVHDEFNYMINPLYPDAHGCIVVHKSEKYTFDRRLTDIRDASS
jgi:hypothetical protein